MSIRQRIVQISGFPGPGLGPSLGIAVILRRFLAQHGESNAQDCRRRDCQARHLIPNTGHTMQQDQIHNTSKTWRQPSSKQPQARRGRQRYDRRPRHLALGRV
jgi:hypothetical protein